MCPADTSPPPRIPPKALDDPNPPQSGVPPFASHEDILYHVSIVPGARDTLEMRQKIGADFLIFCWRPIEAWPAWPPSAIRACAARRRGGHGGTPGARPVCLWRISPIEARTNARTHATPPDPVYHPYVTRLPEQRRLPPPSWKNRARQRHRTPRTTRQPRANHAPTTRNRPTTPRNPRKAPDHVSRSQPIQSQNPTLRHASIPLARFISATTQLFRQVQHHPSVGTPSPEASPRFNRFPRAFLSIAST